MRVIQAVAMLVAIAVPAQAAKVGTNFTEFWVSRDGETAVVEGSWRLVGGQSGSQVPAVNSVIIECSKSQKICYEYIARLIPPDEPPATGSGILFLSKNAFEIKSWSAEKIIATAEHRAVDWMMIINLSQKTAERHSQETGARGAEGARTIPDKWILP